MNVLLIYLQGMLTNLPKRLPSPELDSGEAQALELLSAFSPGSWVRRHAVMMPTSTLIWDSGFLSSGLMCCIATPAPTRMSISETALCPHFYLCHDRMRPSNAAAFFLTSRCILVRFHTYSGAALLPMWLHPLIHTTCIY